MEYSDKVLEHFMNPKNVGEIPDADGVGDLSSHVCGDSIIVYIKVDENDVITDVKFKTFGCAAAIASSSVATEMIKGMKICEAYGITKKAIVEALGGLPEAKIHCSLMVEDGIKLAIEDYCRKKYGMSAEEFCEKEKKVE